MSGIETVDFRIGRVLGRCFSILFRDSPLLTALTIAFYVLFVVAMVLVFLPALLFLDNPGEVLRQITENSGGGESVKLKPEEGTPIIILFVAAFPVAIFIYGLFYAFIIERAMQKSLGVSAGMNETFRRSIRATLPLVGVGFIVTVLFYIGFLFLLIPGIFVAIILLSLSGRGRRRAGRRFRKPRPERRAHQGTSMAHFRAPCDLPSGFHDPPIHRAYLVCRSWRDYGTYWPRYPVVHRHVDCCRIWRRNYAGVFHCDVSRS